MDNDDSAFVVPPTPGRGKPPVKPGSVGNLRTISGKSSLGNKPKFTTNLETNTNRKPRMANAGKAAGKIAGYVINNPEVVGSIAGGIASGIQSVLKPEKPSNGYGYLSSAPNPAETKLNTGIPLTLLEKNYTKTEENVCSPLHISTAFFSLPTDAAQIVYAWFLNVNTRDYQTRVQEQVNWAVDINTKFSAANIITAMNNLMYALQVYFHYRSIDVYCGFGPNQNDAMYSIRSEWDFDTNFKLAEVARLLARTPIPPNMLEFCRFTQSNFFSGETPNSPIIKVVPFARNSQTKLTSNANLDYVIGVLSNATSIDVWNTLARVAKDWIPGTVDKLYDPPVSPVYNRDFITIFNNLPSANGITGKTYSPNVTTNTQTFTYLSWTNNLDGIATAFTDAYNTTNSKFCNGTVNVYASSNHSRFSYYIVSGVLGWYPSRSYPFLELGRMETYTSNGTIESVSHRFGSDMIINVSPLMQSTTVVNAIDWLLSSTSIKATNVQKDFNPVRGGNVRRRR
jgi:hypothetical protein